MGLIPPPASASSAPRSRRRLGRMGRMIARTGASRRTGRVPSPDEPVNLFLKSENGFVDRGVGALVGAASLTARVDAGDIVDKSCCIVLVLLSSIEVRSIYILTGILPAHQVQRCIRHGIGSATRHQPDVRICW